MKKRKTLALSLSGSGSRLIFYIGFLEQLKSSGVEIDYIAACSGASAPAACFACGTLEEFKKFALSATKKDLLSWLKSGKGGLYNLDVIEQKFLEFTKGRKIEDVRPLMGFSAVDIESGEEVVISMGDIARGVKASCSVPGLFEPISWGGKTLVDGGLLNMLPTNIARASGSEVVVGIDLSGNPNIFLPWHLALKKVFSKIKNILFPTIIIRKVNEYLTTQAGTEDLIKSRGVFSVLGRCMDLVILSQAKKDLYTCDLLIQPKIKKFKLKNFDSQSLELYELGKKTALENIPKILSLIENK